MTEPTPDTRLAVAHEKATSKRCKATSKQTGKQCGQFVAAGFEVCKWHGGGAPQVKAAAKHRTELVKARAQGRLEAMVEGAITRIEELSQQHTHLPTAFNAAKHILDRGIGAVRGEDASGGETRPLIQIGIGLAGAGPASDLVVVDAVEATVLDAPEG
jgi:hypothetical protein